MRLTLDIVPSRTVYIGVRDGTEVTRVGVMGVRGESFDLSCSHHIEDTSFNASEDIHGQIMTVHRHADAYILRGSRLSRVLVKRGRRTVIERFHFLDKRFQSVVHLLKAGLFGS